MNKTIQHKNFRAPQAAYLGFLFQTFLKRPFGYIIAVLYVVYLAVILLIVPSTQHLDPLFIWNVGGFNMPIFNLFFIAASAASIAVAVFRTGRDDGTDLNLSAKPLTKGMTVGLKTVVYLIIMLVVCILTILIVVLVLPVFGQYNEVTNITGVTISKYTGLILSVFIGNIVNMLFFGAVSVFISMVGGQVIVMIGSIGLVFLLSLLNFLFPQVLKMQTDILSDKYDTEIYSFSCNTLGQYNHPDKEMEPFKFACIQCSTNDDFDEEIHFDTKQYWEKACRESGRQAANYIDIGLQLSSIYSSFGLSDSKLEEASKLVIGSNSSYNYQINGSTHVDTDENVEAMNYPIAYYSMTMSQGKSYPQVTMIGGDMNLDISNWYLITTLFKLPYNSMNYLSSESDSSFVTPTIAKTYTKVWNRMNEIVMPDAQKEAATDLYYIARNNYAEQSTTPSFDFAKMTHDVIQGDTSGKFFKFGEFNNLTPDQRFSIVAKIQLYWAITAHLDQAEHISEYGKENGYSSVEFPFSSKLVSDWYEHKVDINPSSVTDPYKFEQEFNQHIFDKGILVDEIDDLTSAYSRLSTSQVNYAETFSNLYQYSVSSFFNIGVVISIWSFISCALFGAAIIVYKKTDFK